MQRLEAFNAKKPGGHDANKEFDWLISTTTNHIPLPITWVISAPYSPVRPSFGWDGTGRQDPVRLRVRTGRARP